MSSSSNDKPTDRRQHILQALAGMLENVPLTKLTTAKLAAEVGVSEAALYRHFPSKTKMFDALISFAEETLFGRIGRISAEMTDCLSQCQALIRLYLEFCERNPGISQVLTGRALTGESTKLHDRVSQLHERLETQLRQYLREAEIKEGLRPRLSVAVTANLLMAFAEGRVSQFCRSHFKNLPTQDWSEQWALLSGDLMRPPS